MAKGRDERRLSAILAADVVGYSKLIEADESATRAALRAVHSEVTDPHIAEHAGRIVSTAGDSILAEFNSVVDAVQCAAEIQRAMASRNETVPEDKRIEFRIGVNVGDIIVEGDDIHGDGVNVAARLEGLTDPGGIFISGDAFRQVRNKLELGFEDLGEREVKNIAEPIQVYRVLLDPEAAGVLIAAKVPRQTPWRRLSAAAVLIIVIGGGAIWNFAIRDNRLRVEAASLERMAFELPDKPSIAVLPFDNLIGDPKQDYIGDGLTESITAVLSASPDLFVIARNSAFTYKGRPTRVQEVAERLGVRYVLEGSVQQVGNDLRVTARLIDMIDGLHLWSEQYDRELDNVFDLQDDISQRILLELHVNLTRGEGNRTVWEDLGDPDTYRLYMKALNRFQTFSPDGIIEAERLAVEVLKRKPESASANGFMGWVLWAKVGGGLAEKGDFVRAREFAEKALTLAVNKSGAEAQARLLLASIDVPSMAYDAAIEHVNRALKLTPGGFGVAGWVKVMSGQPAEGVELLKRSMRTGPFYPHWIPGQLGFGLTVLGRYDEAKAINQGILESDTDFAGGHPEALTQLAVIAMFEDDKATARQFVGRLLELQPNRRVGDSRRDLFFMKDKDFLERRLEALREAGMEEFVTKSVTPRGIVLGTVFYALEKATTQAQLHCSQYELDAKYVPDDLPDGVVTFECVDR